MKTTEYITPSGARVTIVDPQTPDFQKRLEKAVVDFMTKHERSKKNGRM